MPTVTISLPRPHPTQAQVKREAQRFNVIAAGRRWGKNTIAEELVIETALSGKPVAWFAPTHKLLADTWRQLTHLLQPVTKGANATEHVIQLLVPRGQVDMWSLVDPDIAGRGRAYARIVVDEAAKVPGLEHAWTHALRPTLTDYEGDAWFLSTPMGHNYFWQLWERGQEPWRSWRFPTSANPHIPPKEIEDARRDMPERTFAQEYLAEFLDDAGGVFRKVRESATATRQERGFEFPHRYIIGVDWGKYEDFTAICIVDLFTRECVAIDRFRQIDYAVQTDRLRVWWERFNKCPIIAERNAMGDPLVEQLQRAGFPVQPFITTAETKREAIETLALAFEQGTIRIIPDENLLSELVAYQTERLPSGLLRYSAPHGMHDDMVMALAMAWQGVGPVLQQKMEPIWGEKRISVEVPW